MTRDELFKRLELITDPAKDHGKLLTNLHYTHFFLMDQYKKDLIKYKLTSPQLNVLGIIGERYPQSVSLEEIKAKVLEPSSDVSRIVARLSEKAYIEKLPNTENRRKVSIALTVAGLELVRQLESDSTFERFTKDLTLDEMQSFVQILRKLRDNS